MILFWPHTARRGHPGMPRRSPTKARRGVEMGQLRLISPRKTQCTQHSFHPQGVEDTHVLGRGNNIAAGGERTENCQGLYVLFVIIPFLIMNSFQVGI